MPNSVSWTAAELRPPCCSDCNYPRYLLDGTRRQMIAFYSHTVTSQQQGSLANVTSFATRSVCPRLSLCGPEEVAVFGQWTPSKRLRHVPALLRGRADLLSNPSRHPGAGAVNGSVTGILGRRGARPELLSQCRGQARSLRAPHPTVTVVICAHSEVRWDDLVAVVTSVKQQTYRPAEIVLVIDHNPTLQRRSTNELSGVTVVPNDNKRGLPGARNAGVAAARSEIVAFVDDDAVAAHNWLAALVAPYADPHVLGVGGQVVARLGDGASELVPARVRLGRWMQLPRHARGANPGAPLHWWKHVAAASPPCRIRWFRCRAKWERHGIARLRGEGNLRPPRASPPRRRLPL